MTHTRCHLHDRLAIHHPAVQFISLETQPVVAALRVAAARDGRDCIDENAAGLGPGVVDLARPAPPLRRFS
jgi:hypothetical protein